MPTIDRLASYHLAPLAGLLETPQWLKFLVFTIQHYDYDFTIFEHPFVGNLIQQLNQSDLAGMLNPGFLSGLAQPGTPAGYTPANTLFATTTIAPREIDVKLPGGPYAVYNWELTYHIPVAIAVHLSNTQRFAEAQKWFHYVFDPTNPQQDFWRALPLNQDGTPPTLSSLLTLLSTPDTQLTSTQIIEKGAVLNGYNAILADPFDPFTVARTRPGAFQWYVVMKYLDNLIAWGDSLFLQDTVETLNEATLCYVLAANLLGPKPQVMPQPGKTSIKNFRQLKQAGLDRMSNALVQLESQFPFNTIASGPGPATTDQSGALFGIGRSLYFCIPENQKLLSYWDTVADRLFKIRNSENIEGVFQQLPLFDPPLDPGMLVQAAAAGIDVSAIVSGANQPLGPLRTLPLIQKALELAAEVRSLGSALLSALEKGDAEALALLRQGNEVQIQTLTENIRFLDWRHAQETTNGLLASRASAYERYAYYLRLVGQVPNPDTAPATLVADRVELTTDNWDSTYQALVGEYEQTIATLAYGPLRLAQGSSAAAQSGASGTGALYLNANEASELNTLLPTANALQTTAAVINTASGPLNLLPSLSVDGQFWGLGVHAEIFSGRDLAQTVNVISEVMQIGANVLREQANLTAKTAGYQRRADEWTLQANLAARELMTLGRQILASLIAEQASYHQYTLAQTQTQQAQAVQSFLQDKFTGTAFYGWMQSQLSGLYYHAYRSACDLARRAELTAKQELMRPELDQTQFIQFNYWDTGHKGLLSGDALYQDLKRLEIAYHDANKRELELLRHISLRQLDPLALIQLRILGQCTITAPEWLYDMDTPGLYMRRIKTVALSIPSVVGPYTGVSATLTLQSSTVRTSSELQSNQYARQGQDDARFTDYFGSTDMIVTSNASNDGGLFETNLRDDRFLPFEGAGAVSVWNLSLPTAIRSFDYNTIADVILHIRYTARFGGDALGAEATKELVAALDTAGTTPQALMFCLRYDFPTEWAAFVNGTGAFQVHINRFFFPYLTQGAAKLHIDSLTLYTAGVGQLDPLVPTIDLAAASTALSGAAASTSLTLPRDGTVLTGAAEELVYLVLTYHFGA